MNTPEAETAGDPQHPCETLRGTEWRGNHRIRVEEDVSPASMLRPGALVAGRYLVREELGRGGMGRVFLADDQETMIASRKQVVLKVLGARAGSGAELKKRLEKEANILAGLSSDCIARCYGALMLSDGMPVLVMEYVDGESLDSHLRAHGGRLDEDTCRELLLPIAGALDYAHSSGVFHLDVKPQNIMVRRTRRNGASTCLLDFGIAADSTCSPGGGYGTRPYMAPESGDAPSSAMDVYSLAVTAYECLAGELPYPDGWRMNARVKPPGEETPFVCAVMRGLSEFPCDRPESCTALVDPDIEEIGRTTGQERTRPRRRRFPPPSVENIRLSRHPVANGSVKVEWDWPEDLETCMWAIVEGQVSNFEDVPEEDRRWISRKSYESYGGVAVPSGGGGCGVRTVVVFGVYVLASANRTFACREPACIDLVEKTVSYRMLDAASLWRRLVGCARPVLEIKSSVDYIPEMEAWAENASGRRRLMTIPAQSGRGSIRLPWELQLEEGETVRLRMPRGASGGFRIEHPFASGAGLSGGFP